MREWAPPTDLKSLQAFLGFTNYYHKFIHRYADIAAPLTSLLSRTQEFRWGPPQQTAFEALKTALCTAPVLALPDFTRDFVLSTDASSVAVGATLSQPYNGILRPVCYGSSKLHNAELNYSTTDREFLAIYRFAMKWRCYIAG